jgi:enoyl-CoA hydratase/carnithine racemase
MNEAASIGRNPVSEDISFNAVGSGVFEILLQRPEKMNALGVR